jgi:DNA-directed RNA polymerase subunit RPC12/RpoP
LSAGDDQVGQKVRCPTCLSTLIVPAPAAAVAVGAGAPGFDAPAVPPPQQRMPSQFMPQRGGAGKRYGFNCGYCSSRLEATESMAAQEGQCPTCGNNITIPILDRYGRLIDPKTRQIIKQDPHPVHAYAAAGDRAPRIFRDDAGSQYIRCPRCGSNSPITANNCKSCGMPFTMEGTTLEAAGTSNGFCVASLVLGIIGLPAACAFIPSILAIIFGIIGYGQVSRAGESGSGRGMAIAGMICGGLGLIIGLMAVMG